METRSEIVEVPIFLAELSKQTTPLKSLDDIVAHYLSEIETHPYAHFIGLFNHYAHTRGLPDGEIAGDIVNAVNIVFCFGMSIPGPEVLALRPRSIGITELAERYVIAFLEPPMPLANTALEAWTHKLANPAEGASPAAAFTGPN